MNKIRARKMFAKWLREKDPFLYRLSIKRHALKTRKRIRPSGLSGYDVDESLSGVWDDIVSTVKEIAPTLAKIPMQQKLLKMQMRRAEQGLPPLDMAAYTPAIKIAPEITPESEAAITRMAKDTLASGIKAMIIPAAIGGGILFMMLRKKRR